MVKKLLDSAEVLSTSAKYIDAININKSALLKLDKQNSNDTIIAKIYSNIGNNYIQIRNIDSASIYITEGLTFLDKRKINNSREKGLLYFSLGTVHAIKGDLDNGEKYFNQALKIQIESIGENHHETAATYGNLANVALYKRDLDKASRYLNIALKTTKNTLGENHQKMAGYYNNLGLIYRAKGELKRALVQYENSARITKNNYGGDYIKLNAPYTNMSSLYHTLGNFDKAIDYLLKSISLQEKTFSVKGYELASNYTSLALLYAEINKFDEAINSLEKGLQFLKKTYGDTHESIAINYSNFNIVYRKMNKNNKSIKYGLKALTILNNLPDKNYAEILSINSNISKAYTNLGDYTNATNYSNKALDIFARANVSDKADIYLNLAKIDILKNEDYLYQKHLDSASKHIGYNKFEPENFNNIEDFNALTYFFELKILSFKKKLQSSKNQKHSDSLRNTYKNFLNFQDFVYHKFSRRENKSFRIDQSHFLYEESISNIFERKKDSELIIAFEEAEKVKSRLLLENLNKQNTQKFINIDDSLLVKEYDLEKQLSQLEKKVFKLKDTDSLLILAKNEVFEIKTAQDKLQETIKAKHPDYYNLIYNHDVINIKEVQKLLNPDQSLVEYFVGKQNIFIFLITKDNYTVKQVAKDFPLKKWVTQLREGIYNYWAMPNALDSDFKKYNSLYKDMAFKLYQKLLQPISNQLTHKVIIIPDAELNFIPFDALLTTDSNQISNNKDFPYLLKKHQISYNYSATLYNQLKQKESSKSQKEVLAFAPKFSNNEVIETIAMRRNGLGDLKYNKQEVNTISHLFNTTIFKDSLATKSNFINNIKNHKIIHLSTHAKSNDTYGDYSFIAFSKNNDSLQDDKLYVRDLYNLDLDTDMVVLSACETGLGELKKGEGLISLARAFTFAGARSTITSLWNVNDAQTTKLMTLFYTNLKDGMTKGEALHKAKLTYIENENLSSPYFWAAFVPAGDMQKIDFNSKIDYYAIGIGVFLIVLIFVVYIYKKRKTT
ncbi:CHAT domain-containing tetratricopeptide repeat protein [uncultured Algibacter sp.]|uniref:CHAT domain-containing protein n=1 Tax=uncultured Algibacter sp. TaxID=298659 RepID=UPI003216272B